MGKKTYKVVAVSGNTSRPSRTLALSEALLSGLRAELPVEPHLIELGAIAPVLSGVLSRADAGDELERQLRAIEEADALIVGSPVYRASYTGLFKHLFDLVHHEALIDVPVLLAATGAANVMRWSLTINCARCSVFPGAYLADRRVRVRT